MNPSESAQDLDFRREVVAALLLELLQSERGEDAALLVRVVPRDREERVVHLLVARIECQFSRSFSCHLVPSLGNLLVI